VLQFHEDSNLNRYLSGKFDVQTGRPPYQLHSLAQIIWYLFSIAMDSTLKKMELRGNISTRLRQCTAYTDDILITARTQAMIDN